MEIVDGDVLFEGLRAEGGAFELFDLIKLNSFDQFIIGGF